MPDSSHGAIESSAALPVVRATMHALPQTSMPPFVEGAYQYTDLAIQWGEQYGIGVWLDFHAANGSQNGCAAT